MVVYCIYILHSHKYHIQNPSSACDVGGFNYAEV